MVNGVSGRMMLVGMQPQAPMRRATTTVANRPQATGQVRFGAEGVGDAIGKMIKGLITLAIVGSATFGAIGFGVGYMVGKNNAEPPALEAKENPGQQNAPSDPKTNNNK